MKPDILLVLLVGLLVISGVNTEAAPPKTQSKDLMNEMISVVDQMTAIMEGVTDAKSAQAAKPKLDALSKRHAQLDEELQAQYDNAVKRAEKQISRLRKKPELRIAIPKILDMEGMINESKAEGDIQNMNMAWQMMVAKSRLPGVNVDISKGVDFTSAAKIMIQEGLIDESPKAPEGYIFKTIGSGKSLVFKALTEEDAASEAKAEKLIEALNRAWMMLQVEAQEPGSKININAGKDFKSATMLMLKNKFITEIPKAPKGYEYTTMGTGKTLQFKYAKLPTEVDIRQYVMSLNMAWQMLIAKSGMPETKIDISKGVDFPSAVKLLKAHELINVKAQAPKGFQITTKGKGESLYFELVEK